MVHVDLMGVNVRKKLIDLPLVVQSSNCNKVDIAHIFEILECAGLIKVPEVVKDLSIVSAC